MKVESKTTNKTKKIRPQLGRGMSALLGDHNSADLEHNHSSLGSATDVTDENTKNVERVLDVSIEHVIANKDQPRKIFKENELEELAISIRENGILQPIIVNEIERGKYQIIAGERRFRAAKIAQLQSVPVIVRKYSQRDLLALSIIENVQRQDLNCIEEALAYLQLMTDFNLSQEKVARKIGKSRSQVANYLRILKLPKEVIKEIQNDRISYGHAKILAGLEATKSIRYAQLILQKSLSVRELENLIKNEEKLKTSSHADASLNEKLDNLRQRIEKKTGFHIKIKEAKNGKGSVELKFNNEAELNDIGEFLLRG